MPRSGDSEHADRGDRLEGLNDLADELEEEDDDIDVSFLDDALDDN